MQVNNRKVNFYCSIKLYILYLLTYLLNIDIDRDISSISYRYRKK